MGVGRQTHGRQGVIYRQERVRIVGEYPRGYIKMEITYLYIARGPTRAVSSSSWAKCFLDVGGLYVRLFVAKSRMACFSDSGTDLRSGDSRG